MLATDNNKDLFLYNPDLLDSLKLIIPSKGMLYIGAGDGRAAIERFQDWRLPSMLLVEANPDYQDQLQNNTSEISNWRCATGLLGNSESKQAYYLTSNPAENGTLDPEQLKTIWPNLRENSHIALQQSTVDSLLHTTEYSNLSSRINWAIVDCLPALPILEGATQALNNWEVIQVRVILDENMEGIRNSNLMEIEKFLMDKDFRCCSVSDSYHPAIGTAIFIKDWKNALYKNIEKQEKEKKYFETTIHEQTIQASKFQAQLEEIQQKTKAKQGKYLQVVKERNQLKMQLEKSKQQIADNENNHQYVQEHLKNELVKKLEEKDAILNSLQKQNEKMQKEIAYLSKINDLRDKDIAELRMRYSELRKQKSRSRKKRSKGK